MRSRKGLKGFELWSDLLLIYSTKICEVMLRLRCLRGALPAQRPASPGRSLQHIGSDGAAAIRLWCTSEKDLHRELPATFLWLSCPSESMHAPIRQRPTQTLAATTRWLASEDWPVQLVVTRRGCRVGTFAGDRNQVSICCLVKLLTKLAQSNLDR